MTPTIGSEAENSQMSAKLLIGSTGEVEKATALPPIRFEHGALSVADLLDRKVPLEWHEAVSIARAVSDLLIEEIAAGGPPAGPGRGGITLRIANGALHLEPTRRRARCGPRRWEDALMLERWTRLRARLVR